VATADRPVGRSALAAAVVLHLAVFAALTLSPKPKVVPTGDAVPITVVTHAPPAAPAKAEPAPVPEDARTETPTPQAPPPEPPPPPAPRPRPAPPKPQPPKPQPPKPAPPKPLPTPKPAAKPAPKTPPPPPPTPVKPIRAAKSSAAPSLDLDALQASLAKSTHPSPPRASFAARGPTRAAAAQTATAAGVSQADQAGLSQLLNRLWNPNCSVEGGDAVLVSVTFSVGLDGRLVGRVSALGRESPDPVVAAAARRAIDAVHAVEPYQAAYRGAQFRINFDAKKACANR
jgi:outer membrane biosynthesis protein TonB